MIIEIVTDITTEPVTLTEVKAALRITGTAHDDDLSDMISDARRFVERATDSSVSERSLKVTSDLEMEEWELPFGPVIGDVTSSTNSDSQYVYEYSAGYDPTPPDMSRLILEVMEHWYDKGINSELTEIIKRKIQLLTRNP
jgi:hypothetical protein